MVRMEEDALVGRLLVATTSLREPTFARTVILLLDHEPGSGALGVVINRPDDTPVIDVVPAVADLATPPEVLFTGGPVSPTSAIALGLAAPGAEPEGWAAVA